MFLDKLLSIFGPHIIVLQGLPHILYMGIYVCKYVWYMSTYVIVLRSYCHVIVWYVTTYHNSIVL